MIPSLQSSESAIALARRALDDHNGRFWHGHATGVDADFYELGLLEDGERYVALDIALQEIGSGDRMGPQPPNDFSSHPPFIRERLYAFCWRSANFGKEMYMKFALVSGNGPTKLVLYSLHEAKY
jgi:hypothetical protein